MGAPHPSIPRESGLGERGRAATQLRPVVEALLGRPVPVRLEFWDGSTVGSEEAAVTIRVRTPDAIRRLLWTPGELGVARAFVAGELDSDDDLVEILRVLSRSSPPPRALARSLVRVTPAAKRVGALGGPPPVPAIEHRPGRRRRGRSHTPRRDAVAVRHHYDVSNRFYSLILESSMTYSCARFAEPGFDLTRAQASKHEHVCRKLGLPVLTGARLLDVGCGWGSMAIHAAVHHGAEVVGITVSEEQARLARQRVVDAGVADRVEIRLQDYRELGSETFDAISSIGMFEHVGQVQMQRYFETLRGLLRPHGRLLNHAISSVGGSKLDPNTFIYRYVFPDGELADLSAVVGAMQEAGFEVRDVESLREHYSRTLRCWIDNLDRNWDEAVAEVGAERARAWRLYMAGSIVGFDDGGNNVHQVLGVVPDAAGASGMPAVRPG